MSVINGTSQNYKQVLHKKLHLVSGRRLLRFTRLLNVTYAVNIVTIIFIITVYSFLTIYLKMKGIVKEKFLKFKCVCDSVKSHQKCNLVQ